jgi:soluble lytic murein transglycosylase-like protein
MRSFMTVGAVVILAAAFPAAAQVKLTVKKDGTKLIYNHPRSANMRNLDWLAKRHDRRSRFDEIIERYSARYGVDPVLVRAVIQVESDFNPNCVSHKGARGLMQLMPGTAKRYGVTNVNDPEQNIHGGIRYLAYLLQLFGDKPRALAAYNAGEGAVLKYGGIPPYEETSTYVVRALTVYYGRPYGTGTGISVAGRRGGPKLKGGFGKKVVTAPVTAAAVIAPGVKYLGTH